MLLNEDQKLEFEKFLKNHKPKHNKLGPKRKQLMK